MIQPIDHKTSNGSIQDNQELIQSILLNIFFFHVCAMGGMFVGHLIASSCRKKYV